MTDIPFRFRNRRANNPLLALIRPFGSRYGGAVKIFVIGIRHPFTDIACHIVKCHTGCDLIRMIPGGQIAKSIFRSVDVGIAGNKLITQAYRRFPSRERPFPIPPQ